MVASATLAPVRIAATHSLSVVASKIGYTPTWDIPTTFTTTFEDGYTATTLRGTIVVVIPTVTTLPRVIVDTFTLTSTAPDGKLVPYTSTVTATSWIPSGSGGRSNRTGQIVGGIVGGIGALLAILITIWFCWYRSRRRAALSGNPYPNQEVRHARRTDLASTAEVILRGHILAVGGVVSGATPSTPSDDTDVRQCPSNQVLLNGASALEGGCAATDTSGLPSTPSSGKGTSPDAQPHRAPLAEGLAASRQHGEGSRASSLEGEGEDSAM